MKNFNLSFCRATSVGSQIQILTAALLLTGATSCNKQSEQSINNIAAYRSDASEAQTIDYTTITSNTTLNDRVDGVDYIIKNDLRVTAGTITIRPGVTLMFENGAGLTIQDGGSISAIGEGGNEIYFIGRNAKRGEWKGITILTNSTRNILSHVYVAHGGHSANTDGRANVIVGNNAAIEISQSEFTASDASGIVIAKNAVVRNFTTNSIHTNTTFPVTIDITMADKLRDGNTFTNNGRNFIALVSTEATVQEPVTLRNLAIPYMFTGNTVTTNSITINAGTHLYMAGGAQLTISGNGWLSALGSATNPILLTGEYNQSGEWNAINFVSTKSENNRLEYCQITGGGGASHSNRGSLNLMGGSAGNTQVSIRNCWVKNSAATGIYIQKSMVQYNADIETANQFAGNGAANVYFDVN